LRVKIYFKTILVIIALSSFSSFLYSQDKILRFQQLTIEDGLPQNTVHGIVKDKYGFMWFSTTGGLSRFDGYKLINYITDPLDSNSIINNRSLYLFKDTIGDIWVSFMDLTEICKYNYESDNFTRFSNTRVPKYIADTLNNTYNSIIFEVKTNNYLWYVKRWQPDASNWYLSQVNNRTGNHIIYKDSQWERWTINDKLINYIYLDDNEILWAGSYCGGINFADTKGKCFYRYTNSSDVQSYIIDNYTRAICEDNDGNLWIGTYKNGITRINRKDNTCTYYTHAERGNSLIDNSIRKLYCDSHGDIWIGTKGGIDRFDTKRNIFHHYATNLSKSIPHNWVFAIVEDNTGNIWIGTFGGIAKYSKENDSFYAYNPKGTLNHQSVRALHIDKNNNIWVCTEGGGITFLKRENSSIFKEKLLPTHIKFSNTDLNVNRVYALTEDENGIIWVGTSGGLVRFNPVDQTHKIFSINEGILSNAVVAVLSDLNGHIWYSHKRGLSRFDIKTFINRNYTLNDGLQSLEFSEDAYYRNCKSGEMFFGGVGGFNSFFPDSIKDNLNPPRVILTDLKISNKSVVLNKPVNGRIILTKPITLTSEISIAHQDRSFSIEFAALHFSDPKNNKYLYMLDGFDKDWIHSDATKRFATYSNLNPKTYVFKVKAANCDGVWNETPTTLKIIVLAAWWQTWWFYFLLFIAVLLVIKFGYHLRLAYYRRKEAELTAIVKERTRELEESNQYIKKQSEELLVYSKDLKNINELLLEKQDQIISQSKQLLENNEQLSILNKTKDKLFSIIGHDLRNPFNVTMGFSELLLDNINHYSEDKVNTILQHIFNASQGGNSLLDNLLHWSRSQSGHIIFEPISLNLYFLIEETLSFLEGNINKKLINVRNEVNQTILVNADENMVKTILRNLISNAIKFTYERGSIIIKAIEKKQYVEISVTDNGIGISVEKIKTLFNIETTVSQKGTTDEIGTGLGLFLCKEFVVKQGGEIWVESGISEGSSFKFTLPLA